jgi:hypothetical protein
MVNRPTGLTAPLRVVLAVLVVLFVSALPARRVGAAAQPRDQPRWLVSMLGWLEAVNTHVPGQVDVAVAATATMTLADLQAILSDVVALRDRLAEGNDRTIPYRGQDLAAAQLRQATGLRAGEPVTPGMNRLLHRAAVYHADVATFVSYRGAAGRAPSGPDRPSVNIGDGRQTRTVTPTIHWRFGRQLIDRLHPGPAKDPFAREWYLAVGASIQALLIVSEADEHLSRARQIFPDDAELLFRGACALETQTAPTILAALAPMYAAPRDRLGRNVGDGPPSPRSLLDRAEQLFRRSLELDGGLVEARVRLARLTAAHRRHDEAIDLLRRALDSSPPDDLRYLALMLLGDEEIAVGRRPDARVHYQEAADLSPTAQSPLLALGLLERDAGNRRAAAAALDRLSRIPDPPALRTDPWWDYYLTHERDQKILLRRLYDLLQREAS